MDIENGSVLKTSANNNDGHTHGSVISFHSIYYTLNSQKCCDCIPVACLKKKHQEILTDISGIFKPGMNAILGPTGSGKSSLLDILADRKDRHGLRGQVLMDGQPQTLDFKYRVGYVVQDDIISSNLTVRENLIFSANTRLPRNVKSNDKIAIADEVIEQLGLKKCADQKVGNEMKRGISGGERRRTNIGMELVLSPKVLFLDEPTTGLDSSTARNVMKYLHQLSRKGRTIIFSIHQPRYSIFKLFDTLFLVGAGRCIYHGPSADVLPFFASIGFQCEEHENPADFLLDVCQGDYQPTLSSSNILDGIDSDQQNTQIVNYLHNAYTKSTLYTAIKQQINELCPSPRNSPTLTDTTPKSPKKSRLSEIFYVSQRTLRNTFRNPALVGMQTGVSIFLGILIGLIYIQMDHSLNIGVKNRLGAIFFMVTNQVFGSLSALDLFIKERPLFKHENVSGYYHVSTYFIAKLICDIIPLRTIPAILFSAIAYFMIGFQRTVAKFFIFFFGIYITSLSASSLCFVVSASVEVYGVANLTAAMFCVLTLIFSGFLVEITSVTSFLSWIKWISIFRYASNIFAINEFTGLKLCLPNDTNTCDIDGLDILKEQNIDSSTNWDLWKNFVALGGILFCFLTLTYIQLLRMKKTK
ncbi:unnamed protein product [Adineta steineri]|uniref:ABC transporter domain-containing protein n=1 Tax=Adineta steineri TaxID=433720 RepID=A0A815NP21_9BILA|nr:unnamed protein product [Adineta steineri]